MKAIVYTKYGGPDVLKIQEVETPSPKGNEVLIRVHAVSVNFGDINARNFKNITAKEFNMPLLFWILARFGFGYSKPKIKILGNSFAGEVVTIGNEVLLYKKGDSVFGYTGESMGAYAQFLCMPENGILASKPSKMTYEEASVIPYGIMMAMKLLGKVNIQKGQKVLIVGASGGIGSAAVQLAKHHFGAEVTGVCGTQRVAFVKNLGADKVIDYELEDFTKNGETYDLIFDILGKGSFSTYKTSLNQNGTYLSASFKTKKLLQMLLTSVTGQKKVVCALVSPAKEDLLFINELVEEGKIKSIIDKSFPLEQTAEAHRYVESRRKQGDVVITPLSPALL
ncbi:MAG: NAD(P)-dependent alcohol dehydrogenase [Bacteroidales bacterium]|nr:NAD(P)-dependent alcohol dehydrogenase [Bacteroidales bacterium]